MLTNLVSLITKSLSSSAQISSTGSVSTSANYEKPKENVNPFLSATYGTGSSYGKNQPVQGGYFAGYLNGKPNIVGQKLFIEV